MADISMVFGWAPNDMYHMSVEELADWRERARVRNNPDD